MSGAYWTDKEEAYLREHCVDLDWDEMSDELGRSRESVRNKMIRMGIYKPCGSNRRAWTEEEEEFLAEHYQERDVAYIAKRLNRGMESVKKKAQSMGINPYEGEYLYARTLARCLRCDLCVLHRWMQDKGLRHKTIKRGKIKMFQIKPTDFWKWADKNRALVRWDNYEQGSIQPEPMWVAEEIRNYHLVRSRKSILDSERFGVMRDYAQGGLRIEAIAVKYGRTPASIKHILRDKKTMQVYSQIVQEKKRSWIYG